MAKDVRNPHTARCETKILMLKCGEYFGSKKRKDNKEI